MKKVCMKLCLFSITVMLLVSLSSAAQIHLKNGIVLRGEIVYSDENSVIFNEQDMGMLKLSNEKILKIVEGEEVKKEKTYSAPLKLQEDYFDEYARELRGKGPISFSFSGGLSNIDGGDLNEVIREFTDIFENLSSQFPDANISFDWDEIKWITNYKSELLLNFTPFMSIGFGAEYLTKTNLGTMSFNYDDSWVGNDPLSAYQDVYEEVDFSANTEHKLTIIPLTASLHLFVPMGNTADFFITGGVGYYLGKLEFTSDIQQTEYYTEDYYDSPRIFLFQWQYDASDDNEITYEAKCNTIGYHGGAGLDIKFSPNMSLFIQGNYRNVNLDEWEGDAEFDMSSY